MRNRLLHPVVISLAITLLLSACTSDNTGNQPSDSQPTAVDAVSNDNTQSSSGEQTTDVPNYVAQGDWPKPLPNNWLLGTVPGVSVDSRDHIWIHHRPRSLTNTLNEDPDIQGQPAPSVIEFDQDGNLVQAWGGPEWDPESKSWVMPDEGWFFNEHGIFVDDDGNVWLTGSGTGDKFDHIVYKYSHDGKRLMTIGQQQVTQGSNNKRYLGNPAGVTVDSEANEVYIADGYANRRVIVFDADSGEYKRHWGAYGEKPHDDPLPDRQPNSEPDPLRSFRTPVHSVHISNEGLVYATDRSSNRFQVFDKQGTYVTEMFVSPESEGSTVWDLTFSADPEQRWLFVADGSNNKVWIIDHAKLETVTSFGEKGEGSGQFNLLHHMASDRHGNIYTAQVRPGKTIQKFYPEK